MRHTLDFKHVWFVVEIKKRKIVAFEEHDMYAGGQLKLPTDRNVTEWVRAKMHGRVHGEVMIDKIDTFLEEHVDQ
ncbi:hypothetical protein VPFG_00074 [Vibrio phage nt-1]|uniref:Uncharacterized protein n=1 Tax=Vibrio phage nt-1 TaxID=115992 RepID=R9TEA9_9CAUD|nr:hypothetical protein VPFG_00074 [Vibrio phage nt-1]AGN30076.1 hypothetical protein VPFG_00074 [Vibrio phage nt-1]